MCSEPLATCETQFAPGELHLPEPTRFARAVRRLGEDMLTVRISGDFDSAAAAAMNDAVDHAVITGAVVVEVDLAGVDFFPMQAAAALLLAVRCCRDLRLDLRVVPSPAVTRKLTMLSVRAIVPLIGNNDSPGE